MTGCVGRLAPSPTGALHLGNARTFLLAWLSVRQQQGHLLLRIEDIDSPRVKPWAVAQTIEDLRWLGLDWDSGPDIGGPQSSYIQTERMELYRELLQRLVADRKIYRCTCSRSEVAAAASAPHEPATSARNWPQDVASVDLLEGQIYPGTCCQGGNFGLAEPAPSRPYAWRWRFEPGLVHWQDRVLGQQSACPQSQLGDFVIGKADWTPAYQLAVVADDYSMGVTEVVRGLDLVPSTYRQLAIIDHLGWPRPSYAHVPLMVGPDGRRLAKRHGDTRMSFFRQRGILPEEIVGYLAWTLGMQPQPRALSATELCGKLDWAALSSVPTNFDLKEFLRGR